MLDVDMPALLIPGAVAGASLFLTFARRSNLTLWRVARWLSVALCVYWVLVMLFGRGYCEPGIE